MYKQNIEDRFWSKVDKKSNNECWPWKGAKVSKKGYGLLGRWPNSGILAHRFSWELHNKTNIPPGKQINHHCDNPSCVNPNHLYLGTQKDNIGDCIKRGRKVNVPSIGERNGVAKLTEDNIKEIKKTYIKWSRLFGSYALAKKFGVSSGNILHIIKCRKWKHVRI